MADTPRKTKEDGSAEDDEAYNKFMLHGQDVKLIQPQCATCLHYVQLRVACTAFPQGIPGEILRNEFDHRLPYPGDGGILYEESLD